MKKLLLYFDRIIFIKIHVHEQKNKTKKKVDGGDGYPTVKFTKIIELYT